ncbi:LysR substrate-binding domain-containing protein [Burkholderia ubonensis]|uniref:LysR substrate-binding domain-containing protein n=1 Tax=Burkholderia ubonensis TaxID=101571 RepID=UPI000A103FD9|nr:LysR substrate-binding domain-containing protein [Burkholderia ubonensis]
MPESSRTPPLSRLSSRTVAPTLGYDLNDLYYFVQVVEYGGFAQAGRALRLPRSRLSRRIALLEKRLGVMLIRRSTRTFAVTEIGAAYYARCKSMLENADAAQALVKTARTHACGTIRVSCPIALLHAHVGAMLVAFAAQYPDIDIELVGMNRRVDVVRERLDLALYARPQPWDSPDLVVRVLGHSTQLLVASPALLDRLGQPRLPADLQAWPSMGFGPPVTGHAWTLVGPSGTETLVRHRPRFVTTDLLTLRRAAVAGIGVVQLPLMVARAALDDGSLVRVLPRWSLQRDMIHALFPTRKGMPHAIRLLLDFLAQRFDAIAEG